MRKQKQNVNERIQRERILSWLLSFFSHRIIIYLLNLIIVIIGVVELENQNHNNIFFSSSSSSYLTNGR